MGWNPRRHYRRIFAGLLLSSHFVTSPVAADEFDDLMKLLSIADEPYRQILNTDKLEHPPFVHEKVLTISPVNLQSPWIANRQCHERFPDFPSLQISFKPGTVRDIVITRVENVPRAWVEGPTVQMKETSHDTRLCFESENLTFSQSTEDGLYELKVGPYYLRLFDGYFPMQVKLTIRYPEKQLRFVDLIPSDLSAESFRYRPGEISFNQLFEGKLKLLFRFARL